MADKKSQTPNFAIYLMFSEGLQFNSEEIAQAVLEDFPDLDITDHGGLSLPTPCDTDDAIPMAPIFMGATGADATFVNMMRLQGYGTWDPSTVQPRQMLACQGFDLKAALGRNRSYLCVSAGAKSTSLEDCFRAARLVSCVGAVFARLPICVAAHWESGDHFLSPKGICEMADAAMLGEWPIPQWIGLGLAPLGDDKQGRVWSNGGTVGLRHFTGYELQMAAAPLEASKTAATLYSTAWLPLTSGNQFEDNHTIGVEGGGEDEKLRLRWLPAGATAAQSDAPPLPHNTFVMIHPDSPFDETVYFDTPRTSDGRKQVVTQSPRPGFFKRMMGSARAGKAAS